MIGAVGKFCIPPLGTNDHSWANRMIALLVDGLRYGANPGGANPGPAAAERTVATSGRHNAQARLRCYVSCR
jgi:hypothetical protein